MRRLSGEDAGFWHMERPEQPMNSMAVGVLAPGARLTLDDVRRHLAWRLDELPSFRWRVVPVPGGLHHPVAVVDPAFDLDDHLRHATLPAGAEDDDLDVLVARLTEDRLDRSRPLWRVTLVDGLTGGRQALVLQYHHCLADGSAAVFVFSRVFSDQVFDGPVREPDPVPARVPHRTPAPVPGRVQLVVAALRDHLRALVRLPRLLVETRRGLRAVRRRARESDVAVPGFSGQGPWTPMNDATTARRRYVRAELDLAALRTVRSASGATLNDVLLAVVAGALRRYLPSRGGLPTEPLLTTVPVSTEPTDALARQSGNRFWSFTTSLATDVADPWDRLATIGACAREGKRRLELLGVDLVPRWLDVVPPVFAAPAARSMFPRDPHGQRAVDANILVSNVRGPRERWTLCGRTVQDLHVDGPPSNGVGVNVMVWSYGDRMLLGILAFADALVDPEAFRVALEESAAELESVSQERRSAADLSPAGPPPRRPRSRRRPAG